MGELKIKSLTMKTSIRSPFGWIIVIILPVISSAQENPYRFERPLSVSEYFSPRSNGGANNHDFEYHEDQMAVESQVDDLREKMDRVPAPKTEDSSQKQLRKRRIEVRPRVQRRPPSPTTTPQNNQ